MIYFMRHGLDDERYIGGWSDVGLTWLGKEQVKEAIEYMKIENLKINKIITSDILRARETAKMVGEALGIEVIENQSLRELNKGKLNGMMRIQSETLFPGLLDNMDINTIYPDGESQITFCERYKSAIPELTKEKNVLIVTHRGPINVHYMMQYGDKFHLDKERYGVTHASIHEYNSENSSIKRIYTPDTEKILKMAM